MNTKSLIHPNNVNLALLDPMNLYHINGEIVYLFTAGKFKFDKFASNNPILSTSLSIRCNRPQVIINQNGLVGDVSKKTALFVADVPSHEVMSSISLIREHGGICDKCIVVMDIENGMSDMFKKNKVELYSLVRKSEYGLL